MHTLQPIIDHLTTIGYFVGNSHGKHHDPLGANLTSVWVYNSSIPSRSDGFRAYLTLLSDGYTISFIYTKNNRRKHIADPDLFTWVEETMQDAEAAWLNIHAPSRMDTSPISSVTKP